MGFSSQTQNNRMKADDSFTTSILGKVNEWRIDWQTVSASKMNLILDTIIIVRCRLFSIILIPNRYQSISLSETIQFVAPYTH